MFRKLFVSVFVCLLLCGCAAGTPTEQSDIDVNSQPSSPSEAPESVAPQVSEDDTILFVLDAGHGFADPGCLSDYLTGTESEVTADMVLKLKAELEALGAQVILTHDGETFPSADEVIALCDKNGVKYRTDSVKDDNIFSAYERSVYMWALSKETKIDMFVSIHVNSFPSDESVDRYELYYRDNNPFAAKLKKFCNSFAKKLDNKTKTEASDSEKAFLVTKFGNYPSVLIETGFATNKQAAEKLNDDKWRAEFCKTLAEEMMAHFGE